MVLEKAPNSPKSSSPPPTTLALTSLFLLGFLNHSEDSEVVLDEAAFELVEKPPNFPKSPVKVVFTLSADWETVGLAKTPNPLSSTPLVLVVVGAEKEPKSPNSSSSESLSLLATAPAPEETLTRGPENEPKSPNSSSESLVFDVAMPSPVLGSEGPEKKPSETLASETTGSLPVIITSFTLVLMIFVTSSVVLMLPLSTEVTVAPKELKLPKSPTVLASPE